MVSMSKKRKKGIEDNSDNKSLRWKIFDRNYKILSLLEEKLWYTKDKIRLLEQQINSRNSVQLEYPLSELFFDGIENTHLEIFHFLSLARSNSSSRSKHVLKELEQLEILERRENEESGYIEKQYNSFLERINSYTFKTNKDKDEAIGFISRYYDIETIKKRLKTLRVYIPDPIIHQQKLNELDIKEELKFKEKQEWVEKYESGVKKLRKWCNEEFEKLF